MHEVAQCAGVSTKTLYRLVLAKDILFEKVISDRIARFILEVDDSAISALNLEDGLERILVVYGRLTLDRTAIDMIRLVYSESVRFPELGRAFYYTAIERVGDAIARWLQEQCDRGALDLEDPYVAATMLTGMMAMDPQRAVMMGVRDAPNLAYIESRAKICARTFLAGCARKKA
jgi:hypothetical protein